jgi:hypothetical protein
LQRDRAAPGWDTRKQNVADGACAVPRDDGKNSKPHTGASEFLGVCSSTSAASLRFARFFRNDSDRVDSLVRSFPPRAVARVFEDYSLSQKPIANSICPREISAPPCGLAFFYLPENLLIQQFRL